MRIAVVADDLTGALDTGVKFTQWGFTVQLTDDPEDDAAQVSILNTETRSKNPEAAYRTTYGIAERLSRYDAIYKKVDSTLRGNPGPELQAIMDATGETRAILTPTHPPTGRRVVDGHLLIGDKPITETEYVSELPRKTSFIPEILGTDGSVHAVRTPESIPSEGISVVDSETELDLIRIASRGTRVMAGSAGLADALCQVLRNPPPVMAIVGSMRSETRAQAEQMKKRLGVVEIPIDTVGALNRVPQHEALRRANEALTLGRDMLITSSPSAEAIERTRHEAERLGVAAERLEAAITSALAEAADILRDGCLSGIIVTGGATALAVTERLGVERIQILDEVQPGVPVLKLDDIMAVTKAGGFGREDTLIQAAQFLKRRHR